MTTQAQTQVKDPMAIIEALLKQNSELIEQLKAQGNGGTPKVTRARTAVRTLDTKTGKVYHAHSAAGMAVAPEYGLKIHNFVWYELVKGTKESPAKCPNRFRDISEDEYQKLLAKQSAPKTPAQPTATAKK